MPVVRCVEFANETATDLHAVDVQAGDDLLFPHVDSCLAMALVLNDGRILGGHVGLQWNAAAGIEPATNAVRVMNDMLALRGGTPIARAIFLGDPNWDLHFLEAPPPYLPADPFRPSIPAVRALLPGPAPLSRRLVKGAVDGGVDFLIARNPAFSITVTRFAPPRLKLYECTIASIIGNDTVHFQNATNAVGRTCSRCGKVHTPGPATILGYWHVCRTCNRIFCNICGKWRLSRELWFERARLCPCGGKTQLVA